MSLKEDFESAATRVKGLKSAPSNSDLLDLYALYKQGTEGDVQGKQPSRLNLRDRAKYDAWATRKGLTRDDAMQRYIELVDKLT
ncbi:MAG: acyl-CoA-binding protein [Bradymonadaceae bacterium]|nr:acyl-CoA-binding protein [Lujinxingiaceae bacterium]